MDLWGRAAALWDMLWMTGGVTLSLWAPGSQSSNSLSLGCSGGLDKRKRRIPSEGSSPSPQLCPSPSQVFSSCPEVLGGAAGKLGVCEERRCQHREVPVRAGSGHGHSGAVLRGTRAAAAAPLCSAHIPRGGPGTSGEFPFLSALLSPFCCQGHRGAADPWLGPEPRAHLGMGWDGMEDQGQQQ